ncbi:MAG: response regulator [Pseudomonadales bacterium]
MAPSSESQAQLYRIFALFSAVILLLFRGLLMDAEPGSVRSNIMPLAAAFMAGCYLVWLASSYFFSHVYRHIGEWFLLPSALLVVHGCLDVATADFSRESIAGVLVMVVLHGLVLHRPRLIWIWCGINALATMALVASNIAHPQIAIYATALGIAIPFMGVLAGMRLSIARSDRRHAHFTQTVFDHSPDLLLYGSFTTGEVFSANKAAERMFATTDWRQLAELIRSAYLANHPGEDPRELLVKAFTGEQYVETVEFESANGRRFWGNMAMGRLGVQEDTIMVRVTDVTELREQNQALIEARDAAEHAMAVRTRFLANMSHEIRTPMNGVIGMTSLLLNTRVTPEQASYVETIRSSGESLLSIINDILDFSKIEAGHVELEHQVFDLEHCTADALDIVSTLAANKGLELVLDLQTTESLQVRGDMQRLRQVLVNLLSNAIKFTERGEVILRVRCSDPPAEATETSPLTLCFEVQDSGIGIAADAIPRLFQAFTQADASTTRRYGGTGLGLSICKSLVNLMGGDISVDSREGEGSTFSFNVNVHFVARTSVASLDLAGKKIFAVDDNETNRTVLAGILSHLGVAAQTFASAKELINALRHSQPDLIISDMAMPDMDGAQLFAALQNEHDNLPPVILLTSLDQSTSDWQPFARVLRKPVRPSDLREALTYTLLNSATKPSSIGSGTANTQLEELRGQTVLVAEDNVVNQKVARNMLNKLGVEVDIAADGREAVDMMQQRGYGLIFMDMQMPELDGIAATREIRAGQFEQQPYIIAMTANALAEDRQACLDSGMNDFVSKPVRMQDLRQSLERACRPIEQLR